MAKNFYEKLNISLNADDKTILNALQRIAQSGQYSLEEIQTIKETLLNPEKRAEYNQTIIHSQKNFYELLNILPNASENIILNAIRRKAQNNELSLEEIQEIKETLLNKEKRAEYNQTIVIENKSENLPKIQKSSRGFSKSFLIVFAIILLSVMGYSIHYYYNNYYVYRITGGEKFFFNERRSILDYPDKEELQPEMKNDRKIIDYISTTQDSHRNMVVLYQNRFYHDKNKDRERHIQWFNLDLPNGYNSEMYQKTKKINEYIANNKKLTKVKLLDSGKLMITGIDETFIFNLHDDSVKKIPLGFADVVDDNYLFFNNARTKFSKEEQNQIFENKNHILITKYKIFFYDLANDKLIEEFHIPFQMELNYDDDYTWHYFSDFTDKQGKKLAIFTRKVFKNNGKVDADNTHNIIEIYQLNKDKGVLNSVNKIFSKEFIGEYIEIPKFSDNGKELYFIKTPIKDYKEYVIKNNHQNAQFVRYDFMKNQEIKSTNIDTYDVKNYHFNPKTNEFFAIGTPDAETRLLSNSEMYKKAKDLMYSNFYGTYYHDLSKEHGIIDNLNTINIYRKDQCGDFVFSKNSHIFAPFCTNYHFVYFHRSDEINYLKTVLEEAEEKRIF